jgi:hypothetical protein
MKPIILKENISRVSIDHLTFFLFSTSRLRSFLALFVPYALPGKSVPMYTFSDDTVSIHDAAWVTLEEVSSFYVQKDKKWNRSALQTQIYAVQPLFIEDTNLYLLLNRLVHPTKPSSWILAWKFRSADLLTRTHVVGKSITIKRLQYNHIRYLWIS